MNLMVGKHGCVKTLLKYKKKHLLHFWLTAGPGFVLELIITIITFRFICPFSGEISYDDLYDWSHS